MTNQKKSPSVDSFLELIEAPVLILSEDFSLQSVIREEALFNTIHKEVSIRQKELFFDHLIQQVKTGLGRPPIPNNGYTFDIESEFLSQKINFRARMVFYQKTFFIALYSPGTNKQLAEDLQANERKFRILLEAAAQGIIVVDLSGQIILVNAKAEELFGYDRDELLYQPIEMLMPSVYRQNHLRHRNKYILNPQQRPMASDLKISALRKDGSDFPVEISLTSVELYDGLYVMAFITDISERRQLESRLRRMEKLEAIGQLAGGIAHDFNNVLAGIIGLTELAMRKLPPDAPQNRNLKLVIQKAQSAANLVSQLLTFSRKQDIEPRRLNLNQVITSNYQMLQRYLGEHIRIQTKLDNNLRDIQADPSAIDQVLTNLCINARDAMPDGGELLIATSNAHEDEIPFRKTEDVDHPHYIKLTVSDTGIGMSEDVQKHIFEPFYTTKDFGQGTGLGLATVYGIIQQHHGIITHNSKSGEGTSFFIFLPALETVSAKQTPRSSAVHAPARGSATILLVDDDPEILLSHKGLLQSLGYRVLTASDGEEALLLVHNRKTEIDMIVTDAMMPNIGGMELKLMVDQLNRGIKFLFISALPDQVEEDLPFLQKPFTLDDLAQKIEEVLINESG